MNEPVRITFISTIPEFGDGTRARVAIIRTGNFRYRGQDKIITLSDLEQMRDNLQSYRGGVLTFDYDHGSAVGETIEERISAGWKPPTQALEVERYADKEGGILWCLVDLTPRMADYARNKEIKFCSAEFTQHYFHPEAKKDVGTYLHAVAFTNRPFQERLPGLTLMTEAVEALYNEKTQADAAEERLVVGYHTIRSYRVGE